MVCLALSQVDFMTETKLHARVEKRYFGIWNLDNIGTPDLALPAPGAVFLKMEAVGGWGRGCCQEGGSSHQQREN